MSDNWGTPISDKGSDHGDAQPADEIVKHVENFDPQASGWVLPTQTNYDTYNNVGNATIRPTDGSRIFADGSVPTWAANATRYEWKDEYGDVAPPVEELEQQLFNHQFINRVGPKLDAFEFNVDIESETIIKPIVQFSDAALHPVMQSNIKLCQYARPTPIQAYTIPAVLNGHDLIAVAQTGSGKTAAFLIPVLSKLMGKAKKLAAPRPAITDDFDPRATGVVAEPLVLIIVPTRELACQIFDEARRLCYRSMLRPCVAYGGGPSRDQQRELARGCDILIGTPGRLVDFMGRGKVLSLRRVKYTIIDEADELVTPDWETELNQLLSGGDNNEDADHRYMMFSATFPKAAQALAAKYLDEGLIKIKVGRVGSTHSNILQHVVFCTPDKKRECLRDLIAAVPPIRTIVFVNNKRAADEVDDFLYNNKLPSTSIHSDRTQREREDALKAFRTGACPILVTTGVSARGLDVSEVGHVINFDLPKVDQGGINEYVHRIGRTARIGHIGVATSLFSEADEPLAPRLVKLLMENDQKIPSFLQQFKPNEGEPIDFDADEDDFVEATAGGEDESVEGGWGGDGGAAEDDIAGSDAGGDAWGGSDKHADTTIQDNSAW